MNRLLMTDRPTSRFFSRPFDRLVLIAWVVLMIGLCVTPVYRVLRGAESNNMDYDLWHLTTTRVLEGGDIYAAGDDGSIEFMYPPPAAIFYASIGWLGEVPFVVALGAINSLAWVASLLLCVHLVRGKAWGDNPWVYLVPWLLTLPYVVTIYNLGQPNVMLLATVLGAFACLRVDKAWTRWLAGALVGFATAAKAFPVVVLCYLIYRRHWTAVVSMLLTTVFLMVFFPMPFRGVSRHLHELQFWTDRMIFSTGEAGIAQRQGYSHVWKNQSIIASVGRLLGPRETDWLHHRPVELPDAFSWRIESLNWPRYHTTSKDGPNTRTVAMQVNLINLPYSTIKLVIAAVALAMCGWYLLVMPPQAMRTPRTDAIEQAMLLTMTIMVSPLSWHYYGVWLMLAFTVLVAERFEEPILRRRVALVGVALLTITLLNLTSNALWLRPIRGLGPTFFGDLAMLGLLSWVMFDQRRKNRLATQMPSTNAPALPSTP